MTLCGDVTVCSNVTKLTCFYIELALISNNCVKLLQRHPHQIQARDMTDNINYNIIIMMITRTILEMNNTIQLSRLSTSKVNQHQTIDELHRSTNRVLSASDPSDVRNDRILLSYAIYRNTYSVGGLGYRHRPSSSNKSSDPRLFSQQQSLYISSWHLLIVSLYINGLMPYMFLLLLLLEKG